MICPNVNILPHELRGRGLPEGGYLPLGTMCDMTHGVIRCFDCGYEVPGGKYARTTQPDNK